ncbi:hypothetical protein HOG98_04565 [bacterium]|jgi:hypothetical protein|nr:hypothetical protein [bacterium]
MVYALSSIHSISNSIKRVPVVSNLSSLYGISKPNKRKAPDSSFNVISRNSSANLLNPIEDAFSNVYSSQHSAPKLSKFIQVSRLDSIGLPVLLDLINIPANRFIYKNSSNGETALNIDYGYSTMDIVVPNRHFKYRGNPMYADSTVFKQGVLTFRDYKTMYLASEYFERALIAEEKGDSRNASLFRELSSLTACDRPIRRLPILKFLEATREDVIKMNDDDFNLLNSCFTPKRFNENFELYSGYRHLSTAQSCVSSNGLGSMFVSPSKSEAAQYACASSVVLRFAARTNFNLETNAYCSSEYRTVAQAEADGLRITGVFKDMELRLKVRLVTFLIELPVYFIKSCFISFYFAKVYLSLF